MSPLVLTLDSAVFNVLCSTRSCRAPKELALGRTRKQVEKYFKSAYPLLKLVQLVCRSQNLLNGHNGL